MRRADGHHDLPDTEPPPTMPDGTIECCMCGARSEEDRAYETGWRTLTGCDDDEERWRCVACQCADVDVYL